MMMMVRITETSKIEFAEKEELFYIVDVDKVQVTSVVMCKVV